MATKVERHLLRINADRSINVETDIPIVAGSIGVDEVLITFEEPEDWQDMSLTVTMVSSVVDTPYTVLWDGVSAFNVPWELTQEVGVIGFSVLGISSSSQTYQRGLTQSSVGLITIVTPGINVGEPPVEPTPSAYERVLAMIQSLPEVENRAEAVINDLDNAFRGVAQYLPVGMGNVVTAELDGTDSELVSVADAFKNGKLLGAKVYGKSTQDSFNIINLIKPSREPRTSAGITITTDDTNDAVTLSGTATGTFSFAMDMDDTHILTPGTYTISANANINFVVDGEEVDTASNPHTFVVSENLVMSKVYIRIINHTSYDVTFNVMLNEGSDAYPYTPYGTPLPAPCPDWPIEIKSVAEGDLKLTGKCIWGGEQMADDIVAAVNNSAYAWKGEDADGKYVALRANTAVSSKVFYRVKEYTASRLTMFLRAKKVSGSNAAANLAVRYNDNSVSGFDITTNEFELDTVYTGVILLSSSKKAVSIEGRNSSGVAYIYYEQSGLFEGTLTVDDFTPYSGDSLHFLPDGIEPLRSLPDGTRDILTIDANGNGVIERNVGNFTVTETSTITKREDVAGQNRYQVAISPSASNESNSYNLMNCLKWHRSWQGLQNYEGYATSGLFVFRFDEMTTLEDLRTWLTSNPINVVYPRYSPTTEIIPASRMPKVPSQYLNAWLEAKDQNGEEIVTDYSIYYEKSIGALLSQIEQALDAAGYPITDYEPEDAMSVAPELSNDANPVTDAQMAAAVTYGFTLN